MKHMAKVLALTAVITILACSSSPAQQGAGNDVAARVGDRTITVKELEERWTKNDPAEHAETVRKLYDGRRNALDEIIADMLIAQAAKAKNMTPEAYIEAEVSKRAKTGHRRRRRGVLPGERRPDAGPVARADDAGDHAVPARSQEEQTAKQALVTELQEEPDPAVRVLLDAPRAEIALEASDPSIGNREGTGHDRRVLGFPVPVLPARRADAQAAPRDLRRQGARGVEGFSADPDSSAGVQGGGGRPLRGRAGEVLGVSRQAVRQPAGAAAGLPEAVREGRGHGRHEVRQLPRFVEVRRARA